jgi:hypothetical protein
MATIPTIRSYGDYSSSNYGAHSLQVDIGRLTLYFSYKTVVAFHDCGEGLVCSVNNWTVTTGKHLNWIESDKTRRVKDFDARLSAVLVKYGLANPNGGAK